MASREKNYHRYRARFLSSLSGLTSSASALAPPAGAGGFPKLDVELIAGGCPNVNPDFITGGCPNVNPDFITGGCPNVNPDFITGGCPNPKLPGASPNSGAVRDAEPNARPVLGASPNSGAVRDAEPNARPVLGASPNSGAVRDAGASPNIRAEGPAPETLCFSNERIFS